MRSAGAAHKNMEAPQSIDSGDARKWHLVTSHSKLLIPSYESLIPTFKLRGSRGSRGSRGKAAATPQYKISDARRW